MNDDTTPIRMSKTASIQFRKDAIDSLPWTATQEILNHAHLIRKIEDVALELGDNLIAAQQAENPNWWHIQDMLDDILDVLEYVTKKGP